MGQEKKKLYNIANPYFHIPSFMSFLLNEHSQFFRIFLKSHFEFVCILFSLAALALKLFMYRFIYIRACPRTRYETVNVDTFIIIYILITLIWFMTMQLFSHFFTQQTSQGKLKIVIILFF